MSGSHSQAIRPVVYSLEVASKLGGLGKPLPVADDWTRSISNWTRHHQHPHGGTNEESGGGIVYIEELDAINYTHTRDPEISDRKFPDRKFPHPNPHPARRSQTPLAPCGKG